MADLPAKNELWITRFFSGIIRSFRKEEKPVTVNHGATWENPYGVEAGGTYSPEQALSAYGGHGYTNAAVTRASQDLAALPLRLLKGKGKKAEIIEQHPFLDLMEQPSTTIDGFLFREQLRTDLMLSGNCYVLLLGLSDTPESIVRLHPDEVEIVTSPKLGITGYKHTSAGNSVIYPPERVIHGRNASFAKGPAGLYGTGAVQPLHREITSDINSQKLASQGSAKGRPDVLLSPQDPADVWGLERRRQILDQYNGMARSGGALVLSGMVKIDPLQLTPREMEYEKARIFARQSISAVTGVPPVILGLPSANYATARQQSITYWTNQSKAAIRMNHIYTKIAQLFDPDLRVEHDLSGVEALQSVRDAQLARINLHIMNGMPIADAYAYEGLADAPVVGSADDVEEADETEEAQRLFHILRSVERQADLGKKSNAKEAMAALSEATQKSLKKKAKDHNEEHGDDPAKRLTNGNYLAVSYHRGLAAYESNPESVRPSVSSAAQWAMGRVNGLLYALRTGKYRRSPYDVDLLPADHPLKGEGEKKKHVLTSWKRLELAQKSSDWGFDKSEAKKILDLGGMSLYRRAFMFVDKGRTDDPDGYRLPIAKLDGDKLKVYYRGVIAAGSSLRKEPKFGSGYYNINNASDRDIAQMYRQIEGLYEKFGEQAPPFDDDDEQKQKKTDFPTAGDDQEVSLSNSQYKVFDHDFAEMIKEEYPSIWKKGGNIEGNNQYRRLLPIAQRRDKKPQTPTEDMAIRKREAWSARHLKDFRIAGVIAQVKWLTVGSRGEGYMKDLIREEMAKVDDKKSFSPSYTKLKSLVPTEVSKEEIWRNWLERQYDPAERRLYRASTAYLRGAARRYASRVEEAVTQRSLISGAVVRAVTDWSTLFGSTEEKGRILAEIGPAWIRSWQSSGDEQLEKVYRLANRDFNSDMSFGSRDIAGQFLNRMASEIYGTNTKKITKIVEQGLINGLSVDEIADQISTSAAFKPSRARLIARTEATRSVNGASIAAYQEAAQDGINVQKRWLTAQDENVRAEHQELDGQTVGVSDLFTAGGYAIEGPGQFGVADQDCNCRCTVLPVVD